MELWNSPTPASQLVNGALRFGCGFSRRVPSTCGRGVPIAIARNVSSAVARFLAHVHYLTVGWACVGSARGRRSTGSGKTRNEVIYGNERRLRAICRGYARPATSYLRLLPQHRRGAQGASLVYQGW